MFYMESSTRTRRFPSSTSFWNTLSTTRRGRSAVTRLRALHIWNPPFLVVIQRRSTYNRTGKLAPPVHLLGNGEHVETGVATIFNYVIELPRQLFLTG